MIKVIDIFCPLIDKVRQSALDSGFGKWSPNKGAIGSSVYDGMNFWGAHSHMLASLSMAMESVVYPNSMFFRVTNENIEPAYVHSDRASGAYTCVAYLTAHPGSGTAFYQHKASGRHEMPELGEVEETLKNDMISADENAWKELQYVPAVYNRAVIFSAPLFHSRVPKTGIGTDAATGRMVWVSHFHTPQTLLENEHG